MSRRRFLAMALALLAGLALPAPAVAQQDPSQANMLFRIRVTPELNRYIIYRAYRTGPDASSGFAVERGEGWSGDANRRRIDGAACPALGRAVAALGRLPLPAVFLGEPEPYNIRAPRGTEYRFDGFARFPNGAEGSVSFIAYDVPGRTRDAHLAWMSGLARAFDACAGRR